MSNASEGQEPPNDKRDPAEDRDPSEGQDVPAVDREQSPQGTSERSADQADTTGHENNDAGEGNQDDGTGENSAKDSKLSSDTGAGEELADQQSATEPQQAATAPGVTQRSATSEKVTPEAVGKEGSPVAPESLQTTRRQQDSQDLDAKTPPGRQEENAKRFRQEIQDAIELLEFAISTGRTVDNPIIDRIKAVERYLDPGLQWPSDRERAAFEKAYRDLAQFMKPVNIETLRATSRHGLRSPAQWFYLELWGYVLLCATIIGFWQVMASGYVVDEGNTGSRSYWILAGLKPAIPFFYGLLGALAYLIRQAHDYIAERTFDMYRIPEYSNRMLLGFLSGGVVLLFVDAKSMSIGEGAIAFIVGYNTDYLFQTLERLATAVFPKVTLAVTTKDGGAASGPGVANVSISKLAKDLAPGGKGNGIVTLRGPAPPGGVLVSLTADHANVQPEPVTVPAGSTSAQFTFGVTSDADEGIVSITATANGSSSSDTVQILPPAAKLAKVMGQAGAGKIQGTVELNREANEDLNIPIKSDPGWCKMDADTVRIAKGNKQGAFTATPQAGNTGKVTFTATLNGQSLHGEVSVP